MKTFISSVTIIILLQLFNISATYSQTRTILPDNYFGVDGVLDTTFGVNGYAVLHCPVQGRTFHRQARENIPVGEEDITTNK